MMQTGYPHTGLALSTHGIEALISGDAGAGRMDVWGSQWFGAKYIK